MGLLSVGCFIATLVCVAWKPKGLSIGWAALGGAVLSILFGVVHVREVWEVFSLVWDATLTFVAIITITSVLDAIGFFEWAALCVARAARGSGRRVFVYILVLGAVVSALFTNDGTALILTPIVLEKMKILRFERNQMIPFVMATGFVADATSLPFVVSNLTNIVSADYFHTGFLTYFKVMAVPDGVALISSLAVLYLFYRKRIPRTFDITLLAKPSTAIRHRGMFRMAWAVLAALLVSYVLSEVYGWPVSVIAVTASLILLVAGRRAKVIRLHSAFVEAPWSVVAFSIGMYIVVYGLRNTGMNAWISYVIHFGYEHGIAIGTLVTGALATVLSSMMNNLPALMIGAMAIHAAPLVGIAKDAAVYANLIGCDMGTKITPIGSLATLLWLGVLRRRGLVIGWREYIQTGIVLTVPVLFATLTGLFFWLRLVQH